MHGEAEQEAGEELPAVEQLERPPHLPGSERDDRPRRRRAPRRRRRPPGRRRAPRRPRGGGTSTATTWAKNQVVPSCAAYQSTVPKPKKIVVASADPARIAQPAEHPPGEPDVERAEHDRDGPDVGREPPDRDERQEHDRGQRRERQERARRRWVAGQLAQGIDVLDPVVAQRKAADGRPASRSPPRRRGRPAPARRSGCSSGRVPGSQYAASASAIRPAPMTSAGSRSSQSAGRPGDGSQRRPLLRSRAPHRSLETDPDLSGPAIGEPDPDRAAPSRTGYWDAAGGILVLLALGLAFRLIIAYLLPGSGFEVDLASFQFLGRQPGRQRPLRVLRRPPPPFFPDYTPGYLYVLWLVGSVGNLVGSGVGDLIKIPPILGRPGARLPRLVDDAGARRERAGGADRRRDRPRQPGHLVRQRRLGPGRLGRRRRAPARAARAVARPAGAGGDPRGAGAA